MPTSGIGRLACRVSRATVSYNQSTWLLPVRPSTSFTPVARFAIHRDIWSEMNAPPMPQKRQNTASAWMFSPSGPMPLPTPKIAATMLSVRMMAMLVTMNRKMRLPMTVSGYQIAWWMVVSGRRSVAVQSSGFDSDFLYWLLRRLNEAQTVPGVCRGVE